MLQFSTWSLTGRDPERKDEQAEHGQNRVSEDALVKLARDEQGDDALQHVVQGEGARRVGDDSHELPMIEASGVTVAFQPADLANRLDSAR